MANNRICKGAGLLLREMSVHEASGKTDGQLLEQFLVQRDETAFAALVRRHGPMVLSVCHRVLGNATDAEDAFQATFLVLVRKARSLTSHCVLGGWLHGVARRTALKARVAAARRRVKEQAMPRCEAQGDEVRNEWLPLLDEELARLPEKYRLPIVLCDLEGKTRREAAELLRWPEGTVAGRLERSRSLLAKRLIRRSQILSGVVPALLAGRAVQAAMRPGLVSSTVQAAAYVASGGVTAPIVLSPATLALVKGVIQAMFWSKIKIGITVLLVAVGATGVSGVTLRILVGERKPSVQSPFLASSPIGMAFPVSVGEGQSKQTGGATEVSAKKGQPEDPQLRNKLAPKAEEPTTARGYYERGLIQERSKRYPEALADFSKAIQLDPRFVDAYFSRSSIYGGHPSLDKRDYAKAVADLTKILEIEPKEYSARFNCALYHESLREYDKAISDYSILIDGDTDFSRYGPGKEEGLAWAHHYRGRVYHWYKNDYAKAAADYTEALRLEAFSAEVGRDLGQRPTGQLDMGIGMLHYYRGQVYNALKEYAKAEDDFAMALQRNPDYANLLYGWAWQLATCPDPKFRDGKKALQLASKAKEKSGGKNPDCADTLAAAYAEVGDFEKACEWQKKAIGLLDPKAAEERKAMQARLQLYEAEKPYRTQ